MKLVLFDIDGTLLKRDNRVHVQSYRYAIKHVYGIEASLFDIVPDGKVDRQIFLEILLFRGIARRLVLEQLDELFSARYHYLKRNLTSRHADDVLPGVRQLLTILRDRFLLGIVSGNEERSAWFRLEMAGIQHFFDFGAFGNESEQRAHLVRTAIKRAERSAGERVSDCAVLVVGDTPADVLCARQENLRAIAVATGRYGVQELRGAGADLVLPDLTYVPELEQFLA